VTAATVRDCIIGHFGDNLDIVQKLGLSNKSFGWYTEKNLTSAKLTTVTNK